MESRKIGLDYLRATAILCVLIAHTAPRTPLGMLGFAGVEFFFVLSGYLIGGIFIRSCVQNGDAVSWPMIRTFWMRRWLRTVPNYFLFIPIYIGVEQYGLQKPLILYATFTQNLAWPVSHFFPVSWSLAVEEWFYLLLPLVSFAWFKIFGRLKPALIATMLLLFIAPLILRLTVCQGHPFDVGMRKIVAFRLDALMWGVALAAAERYRANLFKHLCNLIYVSIGMAGMLLLSWWVWLHYQADYRFPATYVGALVLSGASLCCAMVLPYCSAIQQNKSVLNKCAYLVSAWSYSLYLCHVPVIAVTSHALGDPDLHKASVIAIAWLSTFTVAAMVYYSFERPILKLRDRMTASNRHLSQGTP